ncbi:MAG: LuxR C-terminal-related transcriptional regulator [Pseudomonadota bacterium]
MTSLHTRHLQEVLDVSRCALECDSMDALQCKAMAAMESSIGAKSSLYSHVSSPQTEPKFLGGTVRGVTSDAMSLWREDYHRHDPLMCYYLERHNRTSSNVFISTDPALRSEYVSSRFYHEFLKPQSIHHVMIIGLKPIKGVPFGVFGLHRSAGERAFSTTEVAKADLLAPYLKAAVERIAARELLAANTVENTSDHDAPAHDTEAARKQRMVSLGLYRREQEVVSLVHRGLTSQAISDELHISVRTVNNHLRSIFEKTGVHNRTSLLYLLDHPMSVES